MTKIFVDGQHGATGLRLAQLLRDHPGVELLELDYEQRRETDRRRALMEAAEIVVFCLPSAQLDDALALAPEGRRVIDTSNRFRTSEGWVYGLPELGAEQRARIAGARRVSNPGCFATAFILLVRPLVEAGVIAASETVHAFAMTGYSAGGARMIEAHEAGERTGGLYALDLDHRHLPEMMRYAGLERPPVFIPAVGGHREGLQLVVSSDAAIAREQLLACYRETYRDCALVRVHDDSPAHVDPAAAPDYRGIDLRVHGSTGRYLLSTMLNNLQKGAAVTACQTINLMTGKDPAEGLR